MDLQSAYQKAISFAANKHAGQTITGTPLPYLVHVCNVAMEILIASQHSLDFNVTSAVQVALLHDTIEDTNTSYEELSEAFGEDIAAGVLALTKNEELPKAEQMQDSLKRIKAHPKEVWAVKLADRITNLQKPPELWNASKKSSYLEEAVSIATYLEGGNPYLENRISKLIQSYKIYLL
ncbi:HD domain-containing protein [Niabella yanshanensis]|uniref:HD domain-containing protein n=1 Tax=Niabella yanshanensis TaxID=577386 RepID=A0ABZ0W579_9BACT|nr:HD domain-containing protein [Niabella yanshanensis]WQD37275.1 HD domain-containing protein [Niabella yanshanensis]